MSLLGVLTLIALTGNSKWIARRSNILKSDKVGNLPRFSSYKYGRCFLFRPTTESLLRTKFVWISTKAYSSIISSLKYSTIGWNLTTYFIFYFATVVDGIDSFSFAFVPDQRERREAPTRVTTNSVK